MYAYAGSSQALVGTPEHRPQQATLLQMMGERCFVWTCRTTAESQLEDAMAARTTSKKSGSKKSAAKGSGKKKTAKGHQKRTGVLKKAKNVIKAVVAGAAAGAAKGAVQGAAEAGSKAAGLSSEKTDQQSQGTSAPAKKR